MHVQVDLISIGHSRDIWIGFVLFIVVAVCTKLHVMWMAMNYKASVSRVTEKRLHEVGGAGRFWKEDCHGR